MATETYRYFQPDSSTNSGTLRTAYGGGAIQNFGDTAEIDGLTLTQRHLCRQLGFPKNKTHYLFIASTASGVWVRVAELFWASVSPHLSTSELATVVTAEPAGFVESTAYPLFQPKTGRKTLFVIGDSLQEGVGAGGTEILRLQNCTSKQAIDLIGASTDIPGGSDNREWQNATWALCNTALGGSSWNNTNDNGLGISENAYPRNVSIAYNQRFRTLAIPTDEVCEIHIALGTNDLAYDATQTAATVWQRAVDRITAFKSHFPAATYPLLQFSIGTTIRRGETVALNEKLRDYNALVRTNAVNAGFNAIVDYEAAHPSFHTETGDTTDTTVYSTDTVHLIINGYAQNAIRLRTRLDAR